MKTVPKARVSSHDQNVKGYDIEQDPRIKKWKTGVEEKKYKVKFAKEKAGRTFLTK